MKTQQISHDFTAPAEYANARQGNFSSSEEYANSTQQFNQGNISTQYEEIPEEYSNVRMQMDEYFKKEIPDEFYGNSRVAVSTGPDGEYIQTPAVKPASSEYEIKE